MFLKKGFTLKGWSPAITFLFFMISVSCFSQTGKTAVSIDRISIDEGDNSLVLLCSFADSDMVEKIEKNKASLRLDISDDASVLKDVIITKEEAKSQNSMLLRIQSPLEASIYKTRKRTFTLQLLAEDVSTKDDKSVVLGSAFKTFDLRPYTYSDGFYLLISTIVLFLIFSLILYLIKPLRQRFRFKRDHVLKYREMAEEGKLQSDPFTFVDIADHDEVVAIDDQAMLLSSWKRLKKLPESKPAIEHANFFDQMSAQSFFNPLAEKFEETDRAWYGLLGILSGWLLFRGCLWLGADQGQLLAGLFDSESLQVSTVIAHDVVLGLTIGLCYASVLALVDQLRPDRNFKTSGLVKTIALRATFIAFAFLIQALVTVYVVQNPYVNGLIAWCVIGIAFVFPLDFKTDITKKLLMGLGIGFFTYSVVQLMGMPYLRNIWGTDIPLFFGLALLGCLASALPYSEIPKQQLAKLKTMKRPELSFRKYRNLQNRKEDKDGSDPASEPKDGSVLQEPQKVESGQ